MSIRWSADEALRWADAWADCDGPPNGDALALEALATEVRRLRFPASELATLRADNAASAKRVMRLEWALKVIHTWATVDGALDSGDVIGLCRRTLDAP